jgi:hypothetical protein
MSMYSLAKKALRGPPRRSGSPKGILTTTIDVLESPC